MNLFVVICMNLAIRRWCLVWRWVEGYDFCCPRGMIIFLGDQVKAV